MIYDSEVDSAAVGDSSNKVNYYGTQLECIKAVENGTADYTYINNHVALFYNSNYDFKNINIIPQGNLRKKLYLLMPVPVKMMLLSLTMLKIINFK